MFKIFKLVQLSSLKVLALTLLVCFVVNSGSVATPKFKPTNSTSNNFEQSRVFFVANTPKPKPQLLNNQQRLRSGNNDGEALNLLQNSKSNTLPLVSEPTKTNDLDFLPSSKVKVLTGQGTPVPDYQGSIEQLRRALSATENGHFTNAIRIRDAMQPSLDRRIIDWRLIVRAREELPNKFIRDFYKEAPHWPSEYIYQTRLEEALWKDEPPPKLILEIFSNYSPRTEEGKVLLALALKATNQDRRAKSYVRNLWRTERLEKQFEEIILKNFKSYLTNDDHFHRVDMYLYDDWVNAATRSVRFLFSAQKKYFDARVAVIRRKSNAKSLLASVPKSMRSHPGFIFAQIQYHRRNENYREAGKLMLSAPQDPKVLVSPDQWWVERKLTSRNLIDIGEYQAAYKIAAGHAAEDSGNITDAEFHAGWYALRFNSNPKLAEPHFKNVLKAATIPASISRAYYWLGRTEEARGRTSQAKSYYSEAGKYGMSYYGQLARHKLGKNNVGIKTKLSANSSDKTAFNRDDRVRAIRRMEDAGFLHRTGLLFETLARDLPTTGQIALLTNMAEEFGLYPYVILVTKEAMKRDPVLAALAFPIETHIHQSKTQKGVEKPLVFAIARQESSFNAAAKSPAGALGLLQLLPSTAQEMANKIGTSFSKSKLTSDPTYNVRLGSVYLDELVESFDGSYIMTFAGYNAGPTRVKQWIKKYGDPRESNVDPIDWIERIPFTETRKYVQKITENLQVYRERIDGKSLDILNDLHRGG